MPADDADIRYPFEMADPQSLIAHPWALVVLIPFVVIFVWAAWLEIRRWWLYGPSRNKRADFPINEDAPSYQPPAPRGRGPGPAGTAKDQKD